MSETNPGHADRVHAGDVGARRATVGTPTDRESVNVPPTRPGAAENAHEDEIRRRPEETFIPETPEPDDRTDAVRSRAVEEESLRGGAPVSGSGPATSYRKDGHTQDGHRKDGHRSGDEEAQLRESIEEPRRELGETVSALAHKADVKARAAEAAESAKHRAAEMAHTAKAKAGELTGTARTRAHEMTGTAMARAHEVTGTARTKAHDMTGTARTKAHELSGKAVELKDRQRGKRPLLMAAVAGAVVVVLFRRARKRRQETTTWRFGLPRR